MYFIVLIKYSYMPFIRIQGQVYKFLKDIKIIINIHLLYFQYAYVYNVFSLFCLIINKKWPKCYSGVGANNKLYINRTKHIYKKEKKHNKYISSIIILIYS